MIQLINTLIKNVHVPYHLNVTNMEYKALIFTEGIIIDFEDRNIQLNGKIDGANATCMLS